jgi:NitT/TauT family transport system substrate-binding protein
MVTSPFTKAERGPLTGLGSRGMRRALALVAGLALAALAGQATHAEVSEVRIARQPGLVYLPMIIVEQKNLLEKQAKAVGLSDLKPKFLTLTSGGASSDALLSGNVDMVMSGATNMLLLSDRTRGDVKGIAGVGGMPMLLVTRNPDVKSLKDFKTGDKIAVPTVKVSTQAVLLQVAAKAQLGNANALDAFTIQLGHPDAVAALSSPNNEVNSHFSLPPFQDRELKIPGVRTVLNSADVAGGPLSNAIVYSRKAFVEANPNVVKATIAALDEAAALIKSDPRGALEIYKAATNDKSLLEEMEEAMKQPGVVFSTTPYGVMLQANHFFETGVIKTKPNDWKDFFFPSVHDRAGT